MDCSVLIVEDDPFIALDLQDTFEDAGFKIIGPVATVKSGLRAIDEQRPTVAILDYNLGNETSRDIALRLFDEQIPFIFVSGQIERLIQNKEFKKIDVVKKPFTPRTLVRLVSELVE